jgi:hypothetical protein
MLPSRGVATCTFSSIPILLSLAVCCPSTTNKKPQELPIRITLGVIIGFLRRGSGYIGSRNLNQSPEDVKLSRIRGTLVHHCLTDLPISCNVVFYALRPSPRRFFPMGGGFFLHTTVATRASPDRKGPRWSVFEQRDEHLCSQMVQTLRELFMALSLPLIKGKPLQNSTDTVGVCNTTASRSESASGPREVRSR